MPTIFYVDDDPDDLDFFKEATADLSKNVYCFDDGHSMLYTVDHPPPYPTVIFVDLNMPRISGFDVLKNIKSSASHAGIPVVILSTTKDRNAIKSCRELGASLYVRKPDSIGKLRHLVEKALAIDWNNFKPGEREFTLNC